MQFKNLGIVLVVLAGTQIYKRLQAIWALDKNAPGKLHVFSALPASSVKFTDQLRNCEDVILLDGLKGWALLSCDAGRDNWNTVMGIFNNVSDNPMGRLHLYNYASPSASPIALDLIDFPAGNTDFHPLGIEYNAPSKTLFVVNHAVQGSRLEVFKLHAAEHFATHIRTIVHPLIHSPNSIAVVDEENIYVTNDHFFLVRYHRLLALMETYLALPIGNVVHVHIPTKPSTTAPIVAKRVARLAFANGVKMLDSETVAVSSTSNTAVNLYTRDSTTNGLKFKETISLPFLPDNLSVDRNGRLLIAGHGHVGALNNFAKTRALCRSGSGGEAQEACKLTATSYVAEWSAYGGLRTLYLDDRFSSSSTAVRDVKSGVGIVTGLYENGILVWKE